MALKAIFSVDVDDTPLQRLIGDTSRLKGLIDSLPPGWQAVGEQAQAAQERFVKVNEALVGGLDILAVMTGHTNTLVNFSRQVEQSFRHFSVFVRDIDGRLGNILPALGKLGLGLGAVAAGTIYGVSRLAESGAALRYQSMGLGAEPNELQSFGPAFGRFVGDPAQFLGGVQAAALDPSRWPALLAAGMTPQRAAAMDFDPAKMGAAMLPQMQRVLQSFSNPMMMAAFAHAVGWDQILGGPQGEMRLRNASPHELAQQEVRFAQQQRQIQLTDQALKQWTDLDAQLRASGQVIERTFLEGLAPMAPALANLSQEIAQAFGALEPILKEAVAQYVTPALKWLGEQLSPKALRETMDEIRKFVQTTKEEWGDIARLFDAVKNFLGDWIPAPLKNFLSLDTGPIGGGGGLVGWAKQHLTPDAIVGDVKSAFGSVKDFVDRMGGVHNAAVTASTIGFESGFRNVPNYMYDAQHTAGGLGQITNTTWREATRWVPEAGLYPNAMAAPAWLQAKIVNELRRHHGGSDYLPYDRPLASFEASGGVGRVEEALRKYMNLTDTARQGQIQYETGLRLMKAQQGRGNQSSKVDIRIDNATGGNAFVTAGSLGGL